MSRIKTYARLKPPSLQFKSPGHRRGGDADGENWFRTTDDVVEVNIPESDNMTRFARKGRVRHSFAFDCVFAVDADQDAVYDHVASDVVRSFLDGYNATIFAYGQTGSGKTYTVEGGYRRYGDRGLIPRALEHVYRSLEERAGDEEICVEISFLELYQEVGYDLLNPGLRNDGMTTELPKVTVLQADQKNVVFRNLTMHVAASEKVAQSLLFQGRTNRKVAETPMNKRSSRSHALFTVHLTARQKGSPVVVKSKLNLVDLAGSERVGKTNVQGKVLTEAKHINRSLHHLELVIVSLQRKASGRHSSVHVPYRNSLLTTVLRDSLGGNCMTAMVATLSVESSNVWESISSCRFAQRVACISNNVRKNEMLDDKEIIKRLKKRISELEKELREVKQGKPGPKEPLSKEVVHKCYDIMKGYVDGTVDDPVDAGVDDVRMFRECLRLLKTLIVKLARAKGTDQPRQAVEVSTDDYNSRSTSRTSGISSAAFSQEGTATSLTSPREQKPREAWTSSPSATPQPANDSKRNEVQTSLVISKREDALQKRAVKLEQVKQHQAKEQVQLSLQQMAMVEKDYQDQVEMLREQIAVQHARILKIQKQGADPSVIGQEKLAEQQLRIRESRIHQMLLETKQQFTVEKVRARLANQDFNPPMERQSDRSSKTATISGVKERKVNVDARRVFSELERQEKEQLQVRCHLEELRMSQIEQQLALKEAATRRKLQAFKEQLKQQEAVSAKPTPPSPIFQTTDLLSLQTTVMMPEQQQQGSILLARRKERALEKKLEAPKYSGSNPEVYTARDSRSSQDHGTVLQDTRSNSGFASQGKSSKELQRLTRHMNNFRKSIFAEKFDFNGLEKPPLNSSRSESEKVSQKSTPAETPRKATTTKVGRTQKLTISEEDREKVYTSAVSRQKDRVAKIRRAMEAASLIQRAWKRYKSRKRKNTT
eukprot:m.22717 g.22717  ORF g.22717 m.22717 type:complete len:941 (+) comp28387_c0_seq1:162-2984(+)